MFGEPAVEHGEVGFDEIRHAQIVVHQFAEELALATMESCKNRSNSGKSALSGLVNSISRRLSQASVKSTTNRSAWGCLDKPSVCKQHGTITGKPFGGSSRAALHRAWNG